MMDRTVGFVTCSPQDAACWAARMHEQVARLLAAGRKNIVVMLDTLPALDLPIVTSLAEFREYVREAGGDCSFVALAHTTIAALKAAAPIAELPIIHRIEDIPLRAA